MKSHNYMKSFKLKILRSVNILKIKSIQKEDLNMQEIMQESFILPRLEDFKAKCKF